MTHPVWHHSDFSLSYRRTRHSNCNPPPTETFYAQMRLLNPNLSTSQNISKNVYNNSIKHFFQPDFLKYSRYFEHTFITRLISIVSNPIKVVVVVVVLLKKVRKKYFWSKKSMSKNLEAK